MNEAEVNATQSDISQTLSRLGIAKVAFAFGFSACIFAQTSSSPLVELYTENRGLYFPAGRTLYAAIFMDGHFDFMDTSNRDLVVRHKTLTHYQVDRLKEILAKRAFRDFHGIIHADRQEQFRDYETNLEVIVHYSQGVQSFTLRGFDAADGKPLPRAINDFLCIVDDLKRVSYRLSSGCR